MVVDGVGVDPYNVDHADCFDNDDGTKLFVDVDANDVGRGTTNFRTSLGLGVESVRISWIFCSKAFALSRTRPRSTTGRLVPFSARNADKKSFVFMEAFGLGAAFGPRFESRSLSGGCKMGRKKFSAIVDFVLDSKNWFRCV